MGPAAGDWWSSSLWTQPWMYPSTNHCVYRGLCPTLAAPKGAPGQSLVGASAAAHCSHRDSSSVSPFAPSEDEAQGQTLQLLWGLVGHWFFQ